MQITKYTKAVPVNQLKVGDIIVNGLYGHVLSYISSITTVKSSLTSLGTCLVKISTRFKIKVKRLGASSKDKVNASFSSYILSGNSYIEFDYSEVTVVRLTNPEDNPDEITKLQVSWKKLVHNLAAASSMHEICEAVRGTHHYSGAMYIFYLLGEHPKLQEAIEDKIADCIFTRVKLNCPIMEFAAAQGGGACEELVLLHARDIARLILNGESLSDIRNRVTSWSLAYSEKKEASVRMQHAFDLSK